ncbi:MAG: hypothetical protein GX948_07135 [Clostridiaceae bacterium]|jgi:hypothetical protein|nr:hypothetical protein [Clostridia bacterium]NMA36603.1 hypothetical protein [Clostridiaceae bacterium]
MSKKYLIVVAALLAVGILMISACHDNRAIQSTNEVPAPAVKMVGDQIPEEIDNPLDIEVDACYLDGYSDMLSLARDAYLVVTGTVLSQEDHPYGYSVISKVRVQEVIKGVTEDNVIDIVQMKDRPLLEEGKSYALFLGDQPDADWYYVLGGCCQGIFDLQGERIFASNEGNRTFIESGQGMELIELRKLFG